MAAYQYKCECGNEFEVSIPMKDVKSKEVCPVCGKQAGRDPKDFAGGYIAKCNGFYGKKS